MGQSETDRVFDEWLLCLARTGDKRAGERLAARWYPKLTRTALRLLDDREQALEAVQEAWIGICRGWGGLNDTARFPAWAFGILHRKCSDRIRRNVRERANLADRPYHVEPTEPMRAEQRLEIDQALQSLSPDHRLAALLFFGEGLTLTELAAATGVPVGTAKSRIFHARKSLKSSLKGDE